MQGNHLIIKVTLQTGDITAIWYMNMQIYKFVYPAVPLGFATLQFFKYFSPLKELYT